MNLVLEMAVLGAVLAAAGVLREDVGWLLAGLFVTVGGATLWVMALIRQIVDQTTEKQRLEAELKAQGIKLASALAERDEAWRALAEARQATEAPRS